MNTKSESELQELLYQEDYDFRYTCGITKPVSSIKFDDRNKIIDAICLHFTVAVSLVELEQLHQGLSILNFIELVKAFPILVNVFKQKSNISSYYNYRGFV